MTASVNIEPGFQVKGGAGIWPAALPGGAAIAALHSGFSQGKAKSHNERILKP
jgi:hypothetical protein